jgi:hypothetical protein
MSAAQRTHFASWHEETAHRSKVIKKLEKIQGLEDLIADWEANPQDNDDYRAYIRHLHEKLRSVRCQYEAMR